MRYEVIVGARFPEYLSDYLAWWMVHRGEEALPEALQAYRNAVEHLTSRPKLQSKVFVSGQTPGDIRSLSVWRFHLFYEVDDGERRVYLLAFLHERASSAAVAKALR